MCGRRARSAVAFASRRRRRRPSMHSHVPPSWENAHHFELRSIAFAEEVVV